MAEGKQGARLVLGVDGGGSKTASILAAADGTILGRGHAGASEPSVHRH